VVPYGFDLSFRGFVVSDERYVTRCNPIHHVSAVGQRLAKGAFDRPGILVEDFDRTGRGEHPVIAVSVDIESENLTPLRFENLTEPDL
jgi:hypothetical protein